MSGDAHQCLGCGYDRTGIGERACPECGERPPAKCPCPLCLADLGGRRACDSCGFALAEDEVLAWGGAGEGVDGLLAIGVPGLVVIGLSVNSVFGRRQWVVIGAMLLIVVAGVASLLLDRRRRHGPLPSNRRWQLRLSSRGVPLREGRGAPRWRRWRRRWRGRADHVDTKRASVTIEHLLPGGAVLTNSLGFKPAAPAMAEPLAAEINRYVAAAFGRGDRGS